MKPNTRFHICGGGMSGLITAYLLKEYTGAKITLHGPLNEVPPMGPWYLWGTPDSGHLLGMLQMNIDLGLVHVGYWTGEPEVRRIPTPEMRERYAKSINRSPTSHIMTRGLNTFPVYKLTWEDLHSELFNRINRWATTGEISYYPGLISSIDIEDNMVVAMNDLYIEPEDWIVVTFPLPVWTRLDPTMDKVTYQEVGFGKVERVPFNWPEDIDYVYCLWPGFGWHRVSKSPGGVIGETMVNKMFPLCEKVVPVQTSGEKVVIKHHNVLQVGRPARGDRSLLSDSISQALTIARIIGGNDAP